MSENLNRVRNAFTVFEVIPILLQLPDTGLTGAMIHASSKFQVISALCDVSLSILYFSGLVLLKR